MVSSKDNTQCSSSSSCSNTKNLLRNNNNNTFRNYDQFWLNNPQILIDPKRFIEFYPSPLMTRVEQLNAIVRFCFYLSIVLILVKQNINYIYLFLISLVMTFLIYQYDPTLKGDEKIELYDVYENKSPINQDVNFVKPSYNNPFMNILLPEILDDPTRQAYSKKSFINNLELSQDVEDKFAYNLYQDVDDVFGKTNSQRQFYTTPITTVPNDQGGFAQWCYGRPDTCKDENGYQCMLNNYRFLDGESRPVMF